MQPIGGYTYQRINQGAGSTVISSDPLRFHGLGTVGTLGGTMIFHDAATVAGTAATNMLFTISQVTGVGTVPQATVFDFSMKKGLTVITSGTVDFVVSTL